MLVVPKLELLAGAFVRSGADGALGSPDPLAATRAWAAEGFSRMQIVDRDALAGRASNADAVEIAGRWDGIEVDLSAGSDSFEQIEASIDAGASRVILGPRALAEIEWLESAASTFPSVLVVETSVRERRVVTRGWARTLPVDLIDLVDDLAGVAIAGLVVASPPGDDLDLALLEDAVERSSFLVFVENGRPTMSALRAYEHRGLGGVVVPGTAFATELDARAVANEFGR